MEVPVALCLFLVITLLVYARIGFSKIVSSYGMWFEPVYWVNYNIAEALAWVAKAAVILPGLIWQKEIWQLHIIALVTSALLIWVSERKLLPSMVAFNTLWIGLSSLVVVRNVLQIDCKAQLVHSTKSKIALNRVNSINPFNVGALFSALLSR